MHYWYSNLQTAKIAHIYIYFFNIRSPTIRNKLRCFPCFLLHFIRINRFPDYPGRSHRSIPDIRLRCICVCAWPVLPSRVATCRWWHDDPARWFYYFQQHVCPSLQWVFARCLNRQIWYALFGFAVAGASLGFSPTENPSKSEVPLGCRMRTVQVRCCNSQSHETCSWNSLVLLSPGRLQRIFQQFGCQAFCLNLRFW